MDSLNKFLVTNNIPKALRHDLRAYYKYRHANVTLEQSMDVLRKLTPRLQTQASAYTEAEWISNTDLFRACAPPPASFLTSAGVELRDHCNCPARANESLLDMLSGALLGPTLQCMPA